MMSKIFLYLLSFALPNVLIAQTGTDNRTIDPSASAFSAISVTIGGSFIVNGSFTAVASERLDHFITRIFLDAKRAALGSITDVEFQLEVQKETSRYASRNIILKRASGEEIIIDLEKFRLTADFEFNPYLQNNDVIIFPKLDLDNKFIVMDGAVNKPGKFQFVEGDRLSDALILAQGINDSYEIVNNATITRLSYDGENEEIIEVDLKDDIYLRAGDIVKINAPQPLRKDYKVTVLGEVNNPGNVYITKYGSRLKDVISKAGGLKNSAWLESAQLIRGYWSDLTLRDNDLYYQRELTKIQMYLDWEKMAMIRMLGLAVYDTAYFFLENEMRFFNNAGIMNFSDLRDTNSEIGTYLVEDGDIIIIPKFENYLTVFGQVPHIGKYEYVQGKDYKYYIEKSGGLGEWANEDLIFLIKGTTKNWISLTDSDDPVKIEPGDFIFVAKERILDFGWYLYRVSSIAGIIGTVATLILLLYQFGK